MAAAAAARGPMALLVSNTSAQWLMLGVGVYYLSPDHMRDSMHRGLLAATASAVPPHPHQQHQQPIVLRMDHTGAMHRDSSSSWIGSVVKVTLLVGGVWVTYILITNVLPDQITQLLPVTQRALSAATEQLAGSMLKIKNVLGHEIKKLHAKQDDLETLQKDTKRGVQNVQDDVQGLGQDLQSTHDTVQRCELSLEQTQAMQAYTGRGVKLLATAVSSILKPEDQITQELNNFIRAGELIFNKNNKNNNRRSTVHRPEEDRPQLSRSTSNANSSNNQLLPTSKNGNGNELDDIKYGRWNANHQSIVTPAM